MVGEAWEQGWETAVGVVSEVRSKEMSVVPPLAISLSLALGL